MTQVRLSPSWIAEDGTEPVLPSAMYLIRPTSTYTDPSGREVLDVYGPPVAIHGSAVVITLDPSSSGVWAYEFRLQFVDNQGSDRVITSYRHVPNSISVLDLAALDKVDPATMGPAAAPPSSSWVAALAALQAQVNALVLTGGTDVSGVTGISVFSRTYLDDADAPAVRSTLGVPDSSTTVNLTGDQSVAGVKTFAALPVVPTTAPTIAGQLSPKSYVDSQVSSFGGSIPVASPTVTGIVRLANDLSGTSTSPTVPALTTLASRVTAVEAAVAAGETTQALTWNGTAYRDPLGNAWSAAFTHHSFLSGPNPALLGITLVVGDIWDELIPDAPGAANRITISSAQHVLDGTDIVRATGGMVRYWPSVTQTVTPTNAQGVEVTINTTTGLVTAVNNRVTSGSATGTTIPTGSYVLSGQGTGAGTSGQWLLDNATVSAAVVLDTGTITPPPTSALPATVVMVKHAGYAAGAPLLGNYPSGVKALINMVTLNHAISGASGTGTVVYSQASGQSTANLATDVRAFVSAGIRVVMSIGGSSDGGISLVNDTQADQMVTSVKGFQSTLGITGIEISIQTANWNTAGLLRLCTRLKTDLGTGFSIGINQVTAPWLTALQTLGSNYDYVGPEYWGVVNATDGRLTALVTSGVTALKTGGVPESKIIPGFSLGATGSNLTPTTTLVVDAWNAAKSANPGIRGVFFFDDNSLAVRATPWDGVLNVAPTVIGAGSGTITSFTATAVSQTQINLAWTYAGTATITTQTITRTGGTGPQTTVANPTTSTRAYSNTGLAASTTYTYTLTVVISTGATLTATVATATQSPAPTTGTWGSGGSGTGMADGSFGAWRGTVVPTVTTWSSGDANNALNSYQFWPTLEYGAWTGNADWSCGGLWQTSSEGGSQASWAACASGASDSYWTNVLNNVKARWTAISRGTLYIRLAHEMNGNWFEHSVHDGEEADFRAAWIRFYNLKQSLFPAAKLVFGANANSHFSYNWTTLWPGDAYVDVCGVDWYSSEWVSCGRNVNNTTTATAGEPFGLEAHRQFALAHGKPLSIPEWGVNDDAGDVYDYVQQMHDYFAGHGGTGAGNLLYEHYYNIGKFAIYPEGVTGASALHPLSATLYKNIF